jgi:hypothetical protein
MPGAAQTFATSIVFELEGVRVTGPTLEAIAAKLDDLRSNEALMKFGGRNHQQRSQPIAGNQPPKPAKKPMSAAQRKKLSAAQKRRYAAQRAQQTGATEQAQQATSTAEGQPAQPEGTTEQQPEAAAPKKRAQRAKSATS